MELGNKKSTANRNAIYMYVSTSALTALTVLRARPEVASQGVPLPRIHLSIFLPPTQGIRSPSLWPGHCPVIVGFLVSLLYKSEGRIWLFHLCCLSTRASGLRLKRNREGTHIKEHPLSGLCQCRVTTDM